MSKSIINVDLEHVNSHTRTIPPRWSLNTRPELKQPYTLRKYQHEALKKHIDVSESVRAECPSGCFNIM
jgi:hypothetical protein